MTEEQHVCGSDSVSTAVPLVEKGGSCRDGRAKARLQRQAVTLTKDRCGQGELPFLQESLGNNEGDSDVNSVHLSPPSLSTMQGGYQGYRSTNTLARFVGLLDSLKESECTKIMNSAGDSVDISRSLSGSDTTIWKGIRSESPEFAVEEGREEGEKVEEDLGSAEVQQLINSLSARTEFQAGRQGGRSIVDISTSLVGKGMNNLANSTTGKIHKCPECEKSFPRKNSLHRHLILHTDQRPFQCSHCEASYKSHTQLARHMRLHSGEKPAKCEHCGREFRTYNELYTHRRTHTGEKPFECRHCGRCFSTRGSRNTHERIHTGVKPHKCEFCGTRFTDGSALRVHRFTHTGEQPYKCKVCGKGFTQAGNLNKHIRNVHTVR